MVLFLLRTITYIGFRHLSGDKLHINKEGQRILVLDFLNQLCTFRDVSDCSEVIENMSKTNSVGNKQSRALPGENKLRFGKGMS